MLAIIGMLLLAWLALIVIGALLKGFVWLIVIGALLFLGTAAYGALKSKDSTKIG